MINLEVSVDEARLIEELLRVHSMGPPAPGASAALREKVLLTVADWDNAYEITMDHIELTDRILSLLPQRPVNTDWAVKAGQNIHGLHCDNFPEYNTAEHYTQIILDYAPMLLAPTAPANGSQGGLQPWMVKDGDHASALASAGIGTDEDYEHGSCLGDEG